MAAGAAVDPLPELRGEADFDFLAMQYALLLVGLKHMGTLADGGSEDSASFAIALDAIAREVPFASMGGQPTRWGQTLFRS